MYMQSKHSFTPKCNTRFVYRKLAPSTTHTVSILLLLLIYCPYSLLPTFSNSVISYLSVIRQRPLKQFLNRSDVRFVVCIHASYHDANSILLILPSVKPYRNMAGLARKLSIGTNIKANKSNSDRLRGYQNLPIVCAKDRLFSSEHCRRRLWLERVAPLEDSTTFRAVCVLVSRCH